MMNQDTRPVDEHGLSRDTRIATAIRKAMDMTQVEFAGVLGMSARAVQSYEQGWRQLPRATLLHMFAVLASTRRLNLGEVPCWVLTGCPEPTRRDCRSRILNGGLFCWLVAGNSCGRRSDDPCGPLKCIDCEVIHRLLAPQNERHATPENVSRADQEIRAVE